MKRQKLIDFRGDNSQAAMGERYGVTQQAWANWENGVGLPTVDKMKRLEDDSGIPMEVLFFDAFNNNNLLKTAQTTA